MRLPVVVAVIILGLALAGMVGYTWIHPVTDPQYWSILVGMAATLSGLASYVRQGTVAREVTQIRQQTDGQTTSLVTVADRALAALQVIAADPRARAEVGALLEEIRAAAAASPLGVTLPPPAPMTSASVSESGHTGSTSTR